MKLEKIFEMGYKPSSTTTTMCILDSYRLLLIFINLPLLIRTPNLEIFMWSTPRNCFRYFSYLVPSLPLNFVSSPPWTKHSIRSFTLRANTIPKSSTSCLLESTIHILSRISQTITCGSQFPIWICLLPFSVFIRHSTPTRLDLKKNFMLIRYFI